MVDCYFLLCSKIIPFTKMSLPFVSRLIPTLPGTNHPLLISSPPPNNASHWFPVLLYPLHFFSFTKIKTPTILDQVHNDPEQQFSSICVENKCNIKVLLFVLFYLIQNMVLWYIFILVLSEDRFEIVLYLSWSPKTSLRLRCPNQPPFNHVFPITFHFFQYFLISNTAIYRVGNRTQSLTTLFILSLNEMKRCLFQLLSTSYTMYSLVFSLFFLVFLWDIRLKTKFRGQSPCVFCG
jgi:hypothetical protein